MKKALAIWLLFVFVFNMGGYYAFFWALKVQANKELSTRLDEGRYSELETFEIKIPLSLPYPLQSSDFQRQSGHFVYKQEHYQLVKQKYSHDTLTIVAVKDEQRNQLNSVMDSFSETSGAQPVKDGALNIPVKILLDYLSSICTDVINNNGWSQSISPADYREHYSIVNLSLEGPPPKV